MTINKRVVVLLLALAPFGKAQAQSKFTVDKIAVGGEGGWDYLMVEPSGQRLFVSRGTHVQVINLAQGKVVGDIPNTPGVHGIAIVPELNRGFTSNGRDSTVTVFDATSLAPISTIQIPSRGPDAILYDAKSKMLFTMNHSGHSVSEIDPKTEKVIGTTAIDGTAEAAVADGEHIYINLEDKSEIVKVDQKSLKVDNRWALAPCEEPTGLALDAKHERMFVGCGNKMAAVVDAKTGKVITTVPAGSGVDGIAFDEATGNGFVPNGGDGTVTVFHQDTPDKYSVVETVITQRSARTIALDPRTHVVYLSAAQFGEMPAQQPGQPRQRPPMVPNSFAVVVVKPAK